MDFNKLQTFSVLAYHKNFSKAAESLFVSQPNVTKQIQRLEEELGAQLIERDKQNFSLTDEGHLFLEFCQQVLQLQTHYEQKRQSLKVEREKLNLGTTHLIGNAILPEILLDFSQQVPGLKLNLKVEHSKQIVSMFNKGEISIALLSSYIPINMTTLETAFVCDDPLVVIVPPTHRLAETTECRLIDLEGERFITKDTQSSLYRYLQNELGHPNFLQSPHVGIGTQTSIKHAVSTGLGISIVSSHLIQSDLALNKLSALTIKDYSLKRTIYAYRHSSYAKHETSERFMAFIKNRHSENIQ